jgi:hypothetical protein
MWRMKFTPWMTRPLLAGVFLITLTAGAAPPAQTPDNRSTRARMSEALVQPFNDFNLTRSRIPAVLQKAAAAPYAAPLDCVRLADEIARLDAVLGPDVDAPPLQRGMVRTAASNVAVNALKGATTGWIPFRGVVRRVTGAERHADAQRQAVLAGMTRRAYLKGVGQPMGCFAPVIDAPEAQVARAATPLDAPPAKELVSDTGTQPTAINAPSPADESATSDAVETHATGDTATNAGFAEASFAPTPKR